MYSRPTHIIVPLLSLFVFSPHVSAESLNGVPVEVLARSKVTLADRTVTYLLIRPPSLSAQPPPPPAPATPPSEAELAAQALRDAKNYVDLGIRAIVYSGSPVVTELSWNLADGRSLRAFSSVDFTHLSQLTELETTTTIYGWNSIVSEGDPADLPSGVREALNASPGVQYLFEGTEADALASQSTLQGLDYLHAYYQLHEAALVAEAASRKTQAAQQEREAVADAAKSKDQTVFFWKKEASASR